MYVCIYVCVYVGMHGCAKTKSRDRLVHTYTDAYMQCICMYVYACMLVCMYVQKQNHVIA